eukprot:UN00893
MESAANQTFSSQKARQIIGYNTDFFSKYLAVESVLKLQQTNNGSLLPFVWNTWLLIHCLMHITLSIFVLL